MKLSIITVNLNNLIGLKKTLNSVQSQTFHDFEQIVIDGGSTDGSAEVIASRTAQISHWVSEPDAGIYNAMNKGLRQARGEYIYFLNSGDQLFSSDTLTRIFVHGTYHEDMIYGNTVRPNKSGQLYECRHPTILSIAAFWGLGICQQAIFYKRELFTTLGEFDESFQIAGDWDFNLRVLMARRSTNHLPFPVVHYQGGGISATQDDLSTREKEIVLRRHLPEAVYRDYERLKSLETEHYRLKKFENWVTQIKLRNPLINYAMATKWFWETRLHKATRTRQKPKFSRHTLLPRHNNVLNVGLISIWHIRGITFVAKQLADAMEGPDIRTHILSRWEAEKFRVDGPVFHSRVTYGGDDPTPETVVEWAKKNHLNAVIFCEVHTNDWKRVEALRQAGVRVIATEMLDILKKNTFADYGIFDAFLHIAFEPNRVFRKRHPNIPSLVIPWGVPAVPEALMTPKIGAAVRCVHVAGWGGLNNRKNTDVLLKAWELAAPLHATLTVYSQAPVENYEDDSRRILRSFRGITMQEGTIPDIRTAYSTADILLWPSKREGLGLPILEAAACGLPSLISDGYMMKQWGIPGEHTLVCPATPIATRQYLPEMNVKVEDLANLISLLDHDINTIRDMKECVQRDRYLWTWSWQPEVLRFQMKALLDHPGYEPDPHLNYLPSVLLDFEKRRRHAYREKHADDITRKG